MPKYAKHGYEDELNQPPAKRKRIMKLARESSLLRDGELELDSGAPISEGDDNGAYVQVWMWVPFAGTALDKDKEELSSSSAR